MSDEKTVNNLLRYEVGQKVQAASVDLSEGKTTAPPRYTESKLIYDMENASRFITNSNERDLIRADGIGTARTRGPTLNALVKRGLLESKKSGKDYTITSSAIARNMVSRLPEYLKQISTTAKWEMLLRAIEKGEVDTAAVITMQEKQISQIIELARGQIASTSK